MSATTETKEAPAEERTVRALPVVAVCVTLLTASLVLLAGRNPGEPDRSIPSGRRAGEPAPVRDIDHYVPGTPPAVAERFLRAWMRAEYDNASELSTGAMRQRAERELREVAALNSDQREEMRRTRAYTLATEYDLEHVEVTDLDPSSEGHPRKLVRAQAHAHGAYEGTRMDSRRGQTFTLELIDGAWRVSERTWESTPGSAVRDGGRD